MAAKKSIDAARRAGFHAPVMKKPKTPDPLAAYKRDHAMWTYRSIAPGLMEPWIAFRNSCSLRRWMEDCAACLADGSAAFGRTEKEALERLAGINGMERAAMNCKSFCK